MHWSYIFLALAHRIKKDDTQSQSHYNMTKHHIARWKLRIYIEDISHFDIIIIYISPLWASYGLSIMSIM